MLSVALLGPVEVRSRAGVLVQPAGMLAKRFIAVLALAGGRPVATATIVDELWQDSPPSGARAALQTLVSRLRSAFAHGLIETSPSGYRLACAPEQIDLVRVERLADAPAEHTIDTLSAALDLWRGEPGADLGVTGGAGESELEHELAARSRSARQSLERSYAELLTSCGEFERALAVLRGLQGEHPFDDTIALRLITVLDAAGRPGEALTVFEAHRRRLRDELGSTPSAEVLAAHRALLRADDAAFDVTTAVGAGATAATATSEVATTALAGPAALMGSPALTAPAPTGASTATGASAARGSGAATTATSLNAPTGIHPGPAPRSAPKPLRLGVKAAPNELIGRAADISALNTMIDSARLVTILGAGGLGKTRLAQALAGDEARGQTAVIFVELASVRSPDDLLLAVGQASGVREAQTATRLSDTIGRDDLATRIRSRLAEQPTLLVLDNCEHIVESVAVWAAHELEQVAGLRMLATSRAPLQVAAERVYALSPLSSVTMQGDSSTAGGSAHSTGRDAAAGQPTGPAVQLFFERAQAARPSVVLHGDTVQRLCDRLDGMPLAIELAAARVRSMTVDEIERRLNNRFALLTGGDRTAPERHQTLIAVIDWSWNLLNDAERQLLRRLSLFPDGFSEEAAEVVGAVTPVADLLDALVNQSLVAVTESELTGTMRYRMLETVREFGQMALVDAGEDTEVAASMARWASGFSAQKRPLLDGSTQLSTFRLVTEEQDNLVDILRRALDAPSDPRTVTFVYSLLCAYWTNRGAHWEVVGFARAFLTATRDYHPDDEPEAVEALVRCLATVAAVSLMGDMRTAARARARLRRLPGLADVKDERMRLAARFVLGAGDEMTLSKLMLDAQASTDHLTASYGWLVNTQYAENTGEVTDALEYGLRGYEEATAADDNWTQSMTASMLAQLYSQTGNPRQALDWAFRARDGLVMLNADDDLQQLEWLIAMNRIMIGETEHAGEAIRTLTDRAHSAQGTVAPDMFSRDLASIGWAGLAELERMNGDTAAALANFHTAIDLFATPAERSSPWFLMLSSVYLSAITFDGVDDQNELRFAESLARRVRSRILALQRARPRILDMPVLGSAMIGLAERLMTVPGEQPLLLLALAERLGSRQDSPALYREQHFARASVVHGAEAVAAARARVAALDLHESAALAFSLLKESRALRAR